ncbi:MAG: hypothetical protein AB9915_03685 [Candidatus Dojkabacteria bacterium]
MNGLPDIEEQNDLKHPEEKFWRRKLEELDKEREKGSQEDVVQASTAEPQKPQTQSELDAILEEARKENHLGPYADTNESSNKPSQSSVVTDIKNLAEKLELPPVQPYAKQNNNFVAEAPNGMKVRSSDPSRLEDLLQRSPQQEQQSTTTVIADMNKFVNKEVERQMEESRQAPEVPEFITRHQNRNSEIDRQLEEAKKENRPPVEEQEWFQPEFKENYPFLQENNASTNAQPEQRPLSDEEASRARMEQDLLQSTGNVPEKPVSVGEEERMRLIQKGLIKPATNALPEEQPPIRIINFNPDTTPPQEQPNPTMAGDNMDSLRREIEKINRRQQTRPQRNQNPNRAPQGFPQVTPPTTPLQAGVNAQITQGNPVEQPQIQRIENVQNNTELINAIAKLTEAITKLTEAMPNDPSIATITKNILLNIEKLTENTGTTNPTTEATIQNNTELPQNASPETQQAMKDARVYDGVMINGKLYIKMPQIVFDPNGGEQRITKWVPMEQLGNVSGDNWQQDPNSKVYKWTASEDTQRPELTNSIERVGLTDEQLAKIVGTTKAPTTQTEKTEKKEQDSLPKNITELEEQKKQLEEKLKDPNLTPEQRISIQNSIDNIVNVINLAAEKGEADIEKKAEKVTNLTEEDKKNIADAGRSESGFLAAIKRTFSGGKWKNLLFTSGTSVAGSLAMMKGAGLAVATLGPVGAIGVAGVMLGLGAFAVIKTIRGMREVAESQNLTMSQLIKEKGVLKGAALGLAVSGLLKGGVGGLLPALIPGVGPILPIVTILAATAAEIGINAKLESNLNKEQQELIDAYMNSFEKRRYNKLKDQGIVTRDGINVAKILQDINEPSLSADEKKTAQKTAIATLKYLYEKTKDNKYKFIHYTEKDANGNDVRKEIDVTTIGLQDMTGSSPDYQMTQLTGVNVESFIDTLDNQELINLTSEAWNSSTPQDREGLAKEIITRFVGLEAGYVETLLSEQREKYLESARYALGVRVGTVVGNVIITSVVATGMIGSAVDQMNNTPTVDPAVEGRYRTELSDDDATVSEYRDSTGRTVNAIDLDGDGTNDLLHVPASGEYYAENMTGAEKLFEVQNPSLGDVTISQFPSSTTGIAGTIVGSTGEVVGIVHTDSAGNIGIMNETQFSETLKGTFTSGTNAPITISSIQPDGSAVLEIQGTSHNVNLSQLESIPATDAISSTEGTSGGSIVKVQPGDSVPSLLDKMLDQAKLNNPEMRGGSHELQNYLYRAGGGHGANDSAIRSELELDNPVLKGDSFDIKNSPTVMGWLQELNNGQPVIFSDGTIGTIGTPGSEGVDFSFMSNLNGMNIADLDPISLPPVGGPSIAGTLGSIAGLAVAALAPVQVGKVTKNTQFSIAAENKAETTPVIDPVDPTKEKEYTKAILVKQVFNKDGNEKYKIPEGVTFNLGTKVLTSTANGWLIDNTSAEPEEVADLLLSLEKEEQAKTLTMILDGITSANGTTGRRRINLKPVGSIFQKDSPQAGQESMWTEIRTNREEGNPEKINSATLADRILRITRDAQRNIVSNTPVNTSATQQTGTQTNQQPAPGQPTGVTPQGVQPTPEGQPAGAAPVQQQTPPTEGAASTNTEQKEQKDEKKEKEKREKGRKLLRAGLLVAGVAGGIAATGAGVAIPVAIGASVVFGASGIAQRISEAGSNKQGKRYEAIVEKAKQENRPFTDAEKAEIDEIELKKQKARSFIEGCKTTGYLTMPLGLVSGAGAILNPQITGAGFQVWMNGVIDKINLVRTPTAF